jgi:hypothetical protein
MGIGHHRRSRRLGFRAGGGCVSSGGGLMSVQASCGGSGSVATCADMMNGTGLWLLGGKLFADKRPPLITDIAAAFVDAKKGDGLAASTLEKYGYCIGQMKQVAEELGVKRVSDIDAYFMDRFRKRRTELLSKRPGRHGQNTATKDMVTIRGIVNYALELKLIHDDPLAGYSIKKAKTKPQPYWIRTGP